MKKVLLTILLLVTFLNVGFANSKDNNPAMYKIGEDENISIYLDLDSLKTNLKTAYGSIPTIFNAKYWLYVKSKKEPKRLIFSSMKEPS